jgi:hypothetical protein
MLTAPALVPFLAVVALLAVLACVGATGRRA